MNNVYRLTGYKFRAYKGIRLISRRLQGARAIFTSQFTTNGWEISKYTLLNRASDSSYSIITCYNAKVINTEISESR